MNMMTADKRNYNFILYTLPAQQKSISGNATQRKVVAIRFKFKIRQHVYDKIKHHLKRTTNVCILLISHLGTKLISIFFRKHICTDFTHINCTA